MFVIDVENLEFLEAYVLCIWHTKEQESVEGNCSRMEDEFQGGPSKQEGKRRDQSL